eukprot:876916-Amorphochlora_amoeboformis.AAC.1
MYESNTLTNGKSSIGQSEGEGFARKRLVHLIPPLPFSSLSLLPPAHNLTGVVVFVGGDGAMFSSILLSLTDLMRIGGQVRDKSRCELHETIDSRDKGLSEKHRSEGSLDRG